MREAREVAFPDRQRRVADVARGVAALGLDDTDPLGPHGRHREAAVAEHLEPFQEPPVLGLAGGGVLREVNEVLGGLVHDGMADIGLEVVVPAADSGGVEDDDEAARDPDARAKRVGPAVEVPLELLAGQHLAGVAGEEPRHLPQLLEGLRHFEGTAELLLEGGLLIGVREPVRAMDEHRRGGGRRQGDVLALAGARGHVAVDDEVGVGADVEAVLLDERGEVEDVRREGPEPAGAVVAHVPAVGVADRLDGHLVAKLGGGKDLADHLDAGLLLVLRSEVLDDGIGLGAGVQGPAQGDVLRGGLARECGRGGEGSQSQCIQFHASSPGKPDRFSFPRAGASNRAAPC